MTRWGPVATGGRGRRWPRTLALAVVGVVVAGVTATLASAALVVRETDRQREVIAIPELAEPPEPDEPLNILLVGSDAREGLSAEEQADLVLGDFDGQRADTNILVSINADRSVISLVSIPRDLVVTDPDGVGIAKVSETYLVGREALVGAVTRDVGFPVNHYVEVSISGFMETVDAVGGVTLCLEEPLRDRKSGADFEAGCQRFSPEEALAFVRSRDGALGDLERIERQQVFLRALVGELVDGSLLVNPSRLAAVGADVADSVITDEGLSVELALSLAPDLRDVVAGGLPMVTVPGYPMDLVDSDGVTRNYLVAYEPGLAALVADVEAGRELPSRGTAEQRDETRVQVWYDDARAAQVVESTLLFGGFSPRGGGASPVPADGTTTVYALPGAREQADWVAAHLGAAVRQLPDDVTAPEGVDVVVRAGEDALPPDVVEAIAADAP